MPSPEHTRGPARWRAYDVRLSFHPISSVLNSERELVVKSAVQELELQAGIAEAGRADVIGCTGEALPSGLRRNWNGSSEASRSSALR